MTHTQNQILTTPCVVVMNASTPQPHPGYPLSCNRGGSSSPIKSLCNTKNTVFYIQSNETDGQSIVYVFIYYLRPPAHLFFPSARPPSPFPQQIARRHLVPPIYAGPPAPLCPVPFLVPGELCSCILCTSLLDTLQSHSNAHGAGHCP